MPQLDRLSPIDGPAVVGYRLLIERLQVRAQKGPRRHPHTSKILDL